MSTTNIDANTLAEALATALKPLQELQEQQLAMLTLNTLYAPEEIQRLRGEYTELCQTKLRIKEKMQGIKHREKNELYKDGDVRLKELGELMKAPEELLETIKKLAEFESRNPQFINALKIGKLYR